MRELSAENESTEEQEGGTDVEKEAKPARVLTVRERRLLQESRFMPKVHPTVFDTPVWMRRIKEADDFGEKRTRVLSLFSKLKQQVGPGGKKGGLKALKAKLGTLGKSMGEAAAASPEDSGKDTPKGAISDPGPTGTAVTSDGSAPGSAPTSKEKPSSSINMTLVPGEPSAAELALPGSASREKNPGQVSFRHQISMEKVPSKGNPDKSPSNGGSRPGSKSPREGSSSKDQKESQRANAVARDHQREKVSEKEHESARKSVGTEFNVTQQNDGSDDNNQIHYPTYEELLAEHCNKSVLPPNVRHLLTSTDFVNIVERMLEKSSHLRYQESGHVKEELLHLQKHLNDLPVAMTECLPHLRTKTENRQLGAALLNIRKLHGERGTGQQRLQQGGPSRVLDLTREPLSDFTSRYIAKFARSLLCDEIKISGSKIPLYRIRDQHERHISLSGFNLAGSDALIIARACKYFSF